MRSVKVVKKFIHLDQLLENIDIENVNNLLKNVKDMVVLFMLQRPYQEEAKVCWEDLIEYIAENNKKIPTIQIMFLEKIAQHLFDIIDWNDVDVDFEC
jgi:hypothetical protein